MIYHATQQHIIESINPQRRQQEENKTRIVSTLRCGVLDGDGTDHERGCFPDGAHDYGPAVVVAVLASLEDVHCRRECEEYREEDGGGEGGAECPQVVGVINGCWVTC